MKTQGDKYRIFKTRNEEGSTSISTRKRGCRVGFFTLILKKKRLSGGDYKMGWWVGILMHPDCVDTNTCNSVDYFFTNDEGEAKNYKQKGLWRFIKMGKWLFWKGNNQSGALPMNDNFCIWNHAGPIGESNKWIKSLRNSFGVIWPLNANFPFIKSIWSEL